MAVKGVNKRKKNRKEGRPLLFKTPKELQNKIDEYFAGACNKRIVVTLAGIEEINAFTITGLAYYLGFESRQSFYDYGERSKFSYTIKRARLRLEMVYEERLDDAKPVGAIFALKNLGWIDKVETDHKITLTEPITGIKIIRDAAGI